MSVDGSHESVKKHQRQAAKRRRQARKHGRKEHRDRDRAVTAEHGSAGHNSCGRKCRYSSELMALRAALDGMRSRGAPPLWAYPCPLCGGWHLTSHPRGDGTES